MRVCPRSLRESGFTLVELMIAIFVLLVGVLGSVALVDAANRTSASTRAREGATNLARDVVEGMHNVPIKQMVRAGTNLPATLAANGVGGTVTGGVWKVSRRNFTYTVQLTACAMDDSQDGQGGQDPTFTWCSDSATGTADPNPLDYARVKVVVSWTAQGGTHQVTQSALINNTSSGAAIVSVTTNPASTPPDQPAITSQATSTIGFIATTDEAATSADWFLNGTRQGTTTRGTGGTSFTWQWAIGTSTGGAPCSPAATGVLDGTYLVGAQAYDSQGLSAGRRAVTVKLNRCPPMAPGGFRAVRPGLFPTVELYWNASPEADVIGYYAYRSNGNSSNFTKISDPTSGCYGLLKKPNCIEADPGGNVNYEVRAVDLDPSGNPREGDYTASSSPVKDNQPNTPGSFASGGSTSTLTWTVPADSSKDSPADPIDYFRVYRDGQTVANRYDIVDSTAATGATVNWTDLQPGSGSHTYYVTAVDSRGAESAMTAGVTR